MDRKDAALKALVESDQELFVMLCHCGSEEDKKRAWAAVVEVVEPILCAPQT